MPNTFEILSGFLARFEHEVEGREARDLPPDLVAKLRSFARGKLPASEQGDLIRELYERPEWAATLAAEVKALRNPGNTQRSE